MQSRGLFAARKLLLKLQIKIIYSYTFVVTDVIFSVFNFFSVYKDASVVGTLVILYTNLPMYSGPKKCKPS